MADVQAGNRRGTYVKKGEKATPIAFWKAEQKQSEEEQSSFERLFMLRYYNVFNLEQTTLAPDEPTPFRPD